MTVVKSVIKKMHPYMKENGFSIHQNCFYRINNDLAYCVEFEKPTGLIYVHYYIIPLYVPTEYRYYTYGVQQKDYLAITNINKSVFEAWTNQLKQRLERSIFPVFQKMQTPNNFVKVVNRGLFSDFWRIPEIDIYRLRLFTAFYMKEKSAIPKLYDKYEKIVEKTGYLTDEVKKKRMEEVEKIKNSISIGDEENEALIREIVETTKRNCFGCI